MEAIASSGWWPSRGPCLFGPFEAAIGPPRICFNVHVSGAGRPQVSAPCRCLGGDRATVSVATSCDAGGASRLEAKTRPKAAQSLAGADSKQNGNVYLFERLRPSKERKERTGTPSIFVAAALSPPRPRTTSGWCLWSPSRPMSPERGITADVRGRCELVIGQEPMVERASPKDKVAGRPSERGSRRLRRSLDDQVPGSVPWAKCGRREDMSGWWLGVPMWCDLGHVLTF